MRTSIKASSFSSVLFHQQHLSPVSYLSCPQFYTFAASLLHALILPDYLSEMIPRLFAIQVLVPLIIIASSFTSSVNAADIARARQFLIYWPRFIEIFSNL